MMMIVLLSTLFMLSLYRRRIAIMRTSLASRCAPPKYTPRPGSQLAGTASLHSHDAGLHAFRPTLPCSLNLTSFSNLYNSISSINKSSASFISTSLSISNITAYKFAKIFEQRQSKLLTFLDQMSQLLFFGFCRA